MATSASATSAEETLVLVLKSPFGAGSIVYDWPLKTVPRVLKGTNCYDEAQDLFSTINFVCKEFPYLNNALGSHFPVRNDQCNYQRMTALCDLYNKAIDMIRSGQPMNQQGPKPEPVSKELLRHILEQARHRAVVDPKKLNRVKGFSPDTYGEWTFDYICEMLQVIDLTEDDVVLDLGSGIGNVVLQLAGMTSVRHCVGIEKGVAPYEYSLEMARQFEFLLKWYGKIPKSHCTLLQGDFLDSFMKILIKKATVIFTNNLVFGAVNE